MITADTHFEGFDARAWERLVELVAPGLASRAPYEHRDGVQGVLFVLYESARVVGAFHSERGAVGLEAWPGPDVLADVARSQGARFAVAAEAGALEELYERLGGRVQIEDEPMAALLVGLGAVRELMDEGQLHFWPSTLPRQFPLPGAAMLARTWDYLLPEKHAALVALFDDDGLDTAILVIRPGVYVDRVLGPERIREIVGPIGGDPRRDYRVIRTAIEREIAPLAFGVYARTETVRALLRATEAGSWGAAIASRGVVVDPLPGWMAFAAGIGVVRAAAQKSTGVLESLGTLGALAPAVRRVREFGAAMRGFDVERVLGFNPLRLVAQVLRAGSDANTNPDDSGG